MRLNLDKSIFIPKFLPYITDYSHRWEFWKGSAGSGKTTAICMKILIRSLREKMTVLVCRRYGVGLRNTVFFTFQELIKKWHLTEYCEIVESEMRIKLFNGSRIFFMGLDDESKLLSLNLDVVFVNEASNVPKEMVEQLNLRLRGKTKNNQCILDFNPVSEKSWLKSWCDNPPASFILIESTYKDNPFLSESFVQALEELRERNPLKARVFCDGEWGLAETEGLVFQNWTTKKLNESELAKKFEHRAGMDFGWNDPSAILSMYLDEDNKTVYVTQEFYRTGQTLDELVLAIKRMRLDRIKLYCDSAEPRSIKFLQTAGCRAVPCIKGKDSVKAGISFLQNHKIIVDESCESLIMELSNFSYIKENNSDKYSERTTHEYSHAISALMYAMSDIYTNHKAVLLDKAVLGLR